MAHEEFEKTFYELVMNLQTIFLTILIIKTILFHITSNDIFMFKKQFERFISFQSLGNRYSQR